MLLATLTTNSFSQEKSENTLEPVITTKETKAEKKTSEKLKFSGYVQAQYQVADTAGVASMAGGNFGSDLDNRFRIRRGRLKAKYTSGLSSAVLQIDISEKIVKINEAYINLKAPFAKSCGVTGGLFDRPFGHEVSYSSSKIESLERSRVTQTLFPDEKDLGAQLTFQAPKTSALHFIKLQAGLFDGNGPTVETDSYKDFIGHLSMSKTSKDKSFGWGLGASYYNGGVAASDSNTVYSIKGDKTFVADTVSVGSKLDREYFGFDGQISYKWALGKTQIRAEYLFGTQAGKAKTSSNKGINTLAASPAYVRNFNGYYVYFIQDILQSPFQFVVKYDVYDPNTDISGNEIGQAGTHTGEGDIKYSTLGVGLHYYFDTHTRISAYYDMVTNETTNQIAAGSTLKDLSNDRNDNVFTLRLQYKF